MGCRGLYRDNYIWIPLDWRRYYLTIIPCVAMMSGFCLNRIMDGSLWAVKKGIFNRL